MVKVLDNKAILVDIAPGSKDAESLAAQAREVATKGEPTSQSEGVVENAKNAALAVGGTLGGGLKGVLDTTGNTLGTLTEGLGGTVQGVGDGLGAVAQYTGGAVGSGIMGIGKMAGLTGKGEKEGAEMGAGAVESTEQTLGDAAEKGKDIGGSTVESVK